MTVFQVEEAKLFHTGRMARILKAEKADCLDVDVHTELRDAFNNSCFRKVWTIDGHLTALGGVVGSTLESSGYVWLALSKRARKYPVETLKEAKRQMAEIMNMKTELTAIVVAGDEPAVRFAAHLGFMRPNDQVRLPVRAMIQTLNAERGEPLPKGNGFAIPITYRETF